MFKHPTMLGAGLAMALAAAAALPSVQVRAQGAPQIAAAEATRLCARLGLNPPASLAAQLAPPPTGASDDQLRAWCAGLGFAAEAAEVRAVVSVGSYLRNGAEDTALNVGVQSRSDLLKSGSPSMEQLIRNLSESGLNENGDNRGQYALGIGVPTTNLRNLGAGRTVTVFDGVRLADDTNVQGGGAMNVNNVPMSVLSQIEILRDGGSTAYGGDALGGAANLYPRINPPIVAAPVQPTNERYPQAEPNPIKQAAVEPVSTFSIDVDTASYSNVHRFLNNGQRPPADAVRIEELVNYFDYGYARPASQNEPFRPFVAIAPSPWSAGKQLLHIGVQGHAPARGQEPPLNLVFLVDTSGSMNEPDKAPLVKRSLSILTDQLRPQDRVSLVAYAGSAGVILGPTSGSEMDLIRGAVNSMQPGGSTAGAAGLSLAYSLARQNFDSRKVNRIILMTDGDFNVGVTDNKTLEDYVAEKRQTGIYLSVYGFGTGNYQDARMQAIAQKGNGTAAYVDSLDEARKIFRDDFSGSMFPIADDVKIQIEFNPAQISEYRLIGYETRMLRREDFNNDKVDAGEVGAGVAVTALYEITPVGGPQAIDNLRYGAGSARAQAANSPASELAFLKIRYKLPGQQTSKLMTRPITRADGFANIAAAPEATRWAAAVAAYGQKLRYDAYVGSAFSWEDDLKLAQGARGQEEFGLRAEFIRLVRAAGELSQQRAGL